MPENVRRQVSEAEWQQRVDLAACYRLVAHYGWDDLIFTHISARVPGPEHHFLINPYGLFFDEITASSLVKVDLEGSIVMDTPYPDQPRRLYDSQRHSCGTGRCPVRVAPAYQRRGGDFLPGAGTVAHFPAVDVSPDLAGLP